MVSTSSADSHLHQEYNMNKCYYESKDEEKKKVREADSDWLELGLGLTRNTNRKEKEEEEEVGSAKWVSMYATHGSSTEEVGLDLGLEIGAVGANKKRKEKQKWRFELDHDHGCHKMTLPRDQSHNYISTSNSGLWFELRSLSANREGEAAALPQIPKAYIRVKDENVTVFTVKTYLVTKLGLSNEAEIEISCMGEKLLQSQSLKEVRDRVWLPKLVEFVNSNITSYHYSSNQIPSTSYLMSLHYGRRPFPL